MKDSEYSIVPYKNEYKESFKKINVEWIEEMFEVEPYDLAVLCDPKKYILDRKGMIYFALREGRSVGTCALMEVEPGFFELTKMGVFKTERGKGLGRKLLSYIIDISFKPLENKYFLLTNSNCKAAIHLYEAYGFIHDQSTLNRFGSPYKRANVGMLYSPEKPTHRL